MVEANRKAHIDVVAGIMIIWMVLGHCVFFSHYSPLGKTYRLLSFYMPWFFYKSGSFFNVGGQMNLLKKDSSKLLRYFAVYSLVGWLVWSVLGLIDGTLHPMNCFKIPVYYFIHYGCVNGNGALWFLLSLLLVRQVGNFILSLNLVNQRFFTLIAAIISFLLAFGLFKIGWHNYSWWFGNIFTGLFFFLLGYLFKNIERNKAVFLISTSIYALFIIAFFTGVISDFPYLYMHANKMYRGNYLLFFPMAVAGIIMTNNVFRLMCNRIKFRILEYVGRNSMSFYVTHWILFTIVTFIAKYLFHIQSNAFLFAILLISGVVFLPLISAAINTLKSKSVFWNKIL